MTELTIPSLAAQYAAIIAELDSEQEAWSRLEQVVWKTKSATDQARHDRQEEVMRGIYQVLDRNLTMLDDLPAVTLQDAIGKLSVAESRMADDPDIEHLLVKDALRALKSLDSSGASGQGGGSTGIEASDCM